MKQSICVYVFVCICSVSGDQSIVYFHLKFQNQFVAIRMMEDGKRGAACSIKKKKVMNWCAPLKPQCVLMKCIATIKTHLKDNVYYLMYIVCTLITHLSFLNTFFKQIVRHGMPGTNKQKKDKQQSHKTDISLSNMFLASFRVHLGSSKTHRGFSNHLLY